MLVQQMRLIQNNPYRTVGLLVGATAREQERQVKRLKHFIEADQNPEKDWSFPILGQLDRTIDAVVDAYSILNLQGNKMNAASSLYYTGNLRIYKLELLGKKVKNEIFEEKIEPQFLQSHVGKFGGSNIRAHEIQACSPEYGRLCGRRRGRHRQIKLENGSKII